jgi:hypothetical protein
MVNSGTLEMRIPSIMSCFGSFSIILTYYLFEDLRRLRYVEFVFYVSLSVLIASLGKRFTKSYIFILLNIYFKLAGALGEVKNHSSACYFQDFASTTFNVSAAFWTTVIAYQLWLVISKGQTIKDIRLFHLICWIFPAIMALLPLSTNSYGREARYVLLYCTLLFYLSNISK